MLNSSCEMSRWLKRDWFGSGGREEEVGAGDQVFRRDREVGNRGRGGAFGSIVIDIVHN